MLKGIHPAISPELLSAISEMGHGDEILLADAHFPAYSFNQKVIRANGVNVDTLLKGIMPLFDLYQYVEKPVFMMRAVSGDELAPSVEDKYMVAIGECLDKLPKIERIERFAFYERTKACFAVVLTGETAKYGNIILKKGVTTL